MIGFIITSTVLFCILGMIWKNSDVPNFIIKCGLLMLGVWGVYLIFVGKLLG